MVAGGVAEREAGHRPATGSELVAVEIDVDLPLLTAQAQDRAAAGAARMQERRGRARRGGSRARQRQHDLANLERADRHAIAGHLRGDQNGRARGRCRRRREREPEQRPEREHLAWTRAGGELLGRNASYGQPAESAIPQRLPDTSAMSRASSVRWQRSGSVQADEQSKVTVSPAPTRRARSRMRQTCAAPAISPWYRRR